MRLDVDGVGLDVTVEGDGPSVVLLHGWPDSHRLWRAQVPALQAAGFRTVLPDLRGMGASDAPADVEAYTLPTLLGDVIGIMDQLGIERAHVVGHDWGAALAWVLASLFPARVDRLVALSVGHPVAFRAAGLEQQQKSWYMLLFQFEGVAEEWLSRDDFRHFREWARHPDADAVIADLRRPGALRAGLNWYRANVAPPTLLETPPPLPPIQAPTMGIWSAHDVALTEQQMRDSAQFVTGSWRYERIDDAGHWMQLDAPERLNELLVDFLSSETS
jgi:pimeloyl-ACP methyl ester carboxylesterase